MKNTLRIVPILALLLALSSCQMAEEPAVEEEPEYDVLYFAPLVKGQNSGIQDTTATVIRTEKEWNRIRAKLEYFEEPREVDFAQAMLILLAMPVDTGGHDLVVDTVEYDEDRVLVSYIVYEPGSDCLNVTADITPYSVIEVRRADTPVEFSSTREYVFCEPNL